MEDEAIVKTIIGQCLTSLGYRIFEAPGPYEALDLAGTHPERIDLLLTDVIMPEMNGRELADAFSLQHPEAKVIFMSGYTDIAIASRGILDPRINFIQKPIIPDKLAQMIRNVLGA